MSGYEDGRGRQPVVSTGRGGVGNLIRSPSRGVDPDVHHGLERGRELGARDASRDRAFHSGRGGAGNIRSPSAGPRAQAEQAREVQEESLQARLVAEERGRQAEGNYSTGRGGAGNISRSKSRSRSAVRDGGAASVASGARGSPAPEYRTAGRGGWGNIREEHDTDRDSIEEQKRAAAEDYERDVRAKHLAEEAGKPHSSGKGGAGNIVPTGPPGVDMSKLTLEEREAYNKVHAHDRQHGVSTGRGGPGNIHRAHGGDEERGRGGTREPGLMHNVLRSLSRATGREKSTDRVKGD